MARLGVISESLFCGAPFTACRFESVVANTSAGEQTFHSGADANYGCHIAFTSMALAGHFHAYNEAGVGLVFWRIVGWQHGQQFFAGSRWRSSKMFFDL